ncbi:hypothetical protein H696_06240 [Fonticula alba]|uniref:Uncharacterized protein n=1 Tax=Fonticula alba TaxID=691883 RepID=A0A058YZN1_FONAL|nr:hypothetical protein H696_06240 [Fonticula alba]KCV67331.1 hypothetical protein H696_06240 [Fonticula alba]|eukprot:XP_009498263.1 hypothetical protein H696_06240 [Fonticula alba]
MDQEPYLPKGDFYVTSACRHLLGAFVGHFHDHGIAQQSLPAEAAMLSRSSLSRPVDCLSVIGVQPASSTLLSTDLSETEALAHTDCWLEHLPAYQCDTRDTSSCTVIWRHFVRCASPIMTANGRTPLLRMVQLANPPADWVPPADEIVIDHMDPSKASG